MNKSLLFLFCVLMVMACNQDDSPFSVKPVMDQYNDNGAILKKEYCASLDCKQPTAEEQYVYNTAGKLTRTVFLSRGSSGNVEQQYYNEFTYNADGQLARKVRYNKVYGTGDWVPYEEYSYTYTNGQLTAEYQYFNQRNPDQKVLTGIIEYTYTNGNKTSEKRYNAQKLLMSRIEYTYTDRVMTRESWYDATDKLMLHFDHSFSGNKRQISEYMPAKKEAISVIEKTYDRQGRLVSEESKFVNPLLCVMLPGVIRYGY